VVADAVVGSDLVTILVVVLVVLVILVVLKRFL
jgi:hypothetical protein